MIDTLFRYASIQKSASDAFFVLRQYAKKANYALFAKDSIYILTFSGKRNTIDLVK